jgi:transcriptional regulator with XRE-family HTH domain
MEEMIKLRKFRESLGFSMRALAKETGISRQTISDYEIGKYSPGIANWKILRSKLKIKESYKDFWKRDLRGVGRPRLYDGMTCAYSGCKERPESKGLCMRHYMHFRRHR